jgi:hypothetical protein
MRGYYDHNRDRFVTSEESESEEQDMAEMMKQFDDESDALAQIAEQDAMTLKEAHQYRKESGWLPEAVHLARARAAVDSLFSGRGAE